jgi:dUTP pyrophosphatase
MELLQGFGLIKFLAKIELRSQIIEKTQNLMMLPVKVLRLHDRAKLPQYQHRNDAGMDVTAIHDDVVLVGDRKLISTGLAFEIPEYCMIDVRPRSGLALKHGITVLNSPGTIDSNYRGELKVILINHGSEPFEIKAGDRIAQIVFSPFYTATLLESDLLEDSDRGSRGFGSSGVN